MRNFLQNYQDFTQMWTFRKRFRLRSWCAILSQSWGAPPDPTREVCPDTKVDIDLPGLQKSNDKLFSSIHIFLQLAKNYEELAACWRSCSGWSQIQRQVENHVKSCPRIISTSQRRHKVWIDIHIKTIFYVMKLILYLICAYFYYSMSSENTNLQYYKLVFCLWT